MRMIISKKDTILLKEMVRTDFKLRYQASVLGYVWSLMKPLFTFIILYTIFAVILKLGAREPNYALSLLLGIVLWSFFGEGTAGALGSVVSSGNLIRKISIPRHLIPIAAICSAFINMMLNLVVVFIFMLFGSNLALSGWTLVFFPLLIFELILLTVGVGMFLSAVNVKFRDIEHIWEVVRQALFYAIPIIYPLSKISSIHIKQFMLMNPLVQIIQDARAVTTHASTARIPEAFHSALFQLIPLTIVILIFIGGIKYFNKRANKFAELI